MDGVDRDRDEAGGEGAVDVAEDARADAILDQFVDPLRGGFGVLAVDPGGGCVADHVVVERGGVVTHRCANAGEIGSDPLRGSGSAATSRSICAAADMKTVE